MNPGMKAPMTHSTPDSYPASCGHSWDRESGNLYMNQLPTDGFLPPPHQSMWRTLCRLTAMWFYANWHLEHSNTSTIVCEKKRMRLLVPTFPVTITNRSHSNVSLVNIISRVFKLTRVLLIVMIAENQTRHLQGPWRVINTPHWTKHGLSEIQTIWL